MDWAARRRLVILLIVGAIAVAFLAIVLIATLYKTPSCTDGAQNQDEAGIDCGGPCAYLCTNDEQPPTVLFTKVLQNDGRTDIISLIENKNTDAAAKNVPYRITLYGSDQSVIKEIDGTLDLPPGATEPVYLLDVVSADQKVVNAFLDIDTSAPKWFPMAVDPRVVPKAVHITRSGTALAPRIDAVLENPGSAPLTNVQAIVIVQNGQKSVIAASQTVVPTISAEGQATATFTWNEAFPGDLASIAVMPLIPLP